MGFPNVEVEAMVLPSCTMFSDWRGRESVVAKGCGRAMTGVLVISVCCLNLDTLAMGSNCRGLMGLGSLNGQFLSSTGSLVFGKQADLCQVRCALDNKFLRVNGFTISPEDNLMSL